MGSAQSLLTPEAVVTTVVVAGAVALGVTQLKPASPSASTPTGGSAKKGKKKKRGTPSASTELAPPAPAPAPAAAPTPVVVDFPAVIPGQFDPAAPAVPDATPAAPKKGKKKRKGKPAGAPDAPAPAPAPADTLSDSSAGPPPPPAPKTKRASPAAAAAARAPPQSTASLDTDSSWTRVPRRGAEPASAAGGAPRAELATSDAGATSSAAGDESPAAERTEDEAPGVRAGAGRRTLAERLLPKPRRTGVDDMLETPDYPPLARVMRVQPRADEKPASGFSWADYEDVADGAGTGAENDADGEDDGWGVVKSRGRPKADRAQSPQKAPETITKRQRQNANKREAVKAAKAEAEAERLATLAKHKKALERERLIEQLSAKGGKKTLSGGMQATVDEQGKFFWK